MSELVTMYPAQANSPETSLSGALTAAGTTVNVVDGSVLPEAPNLLTIGADGSTAETVLMTAKNGNVLTVTRAQNGTTARAWSAGDVIARYFTAADQTAMQENIKKLNEDKAEKVASPTAGNFAGLDANGNPTDSGKKPGDFADASHTPVSYTHLDVYKRQLSRSARARRPLPCSVAIPAHGASRKSLPRRASVDVYKRQLSLRMAQDLAG